MISYCKNGKSAQVLACPQDKLNEILDSPVVAEVCRKLTTVDHDSDEAKTLKQGLPLLMFMAHYTDGHRHAKSAVPTNMAYLDLDELNGEDPREVWKRLVQTLIMLELEHLIVLVHVSCSGKGLRIVYIIPSQFGHLSPTERIDQSKQWLAAKLGVTDDSKTKDLARGSFAVPRSYVLYGPDKRLFEENVSESVKQEIFDGTTNNRNQGVSGQGDDEKTPKLPDSLDNKFPSDYHGIPFEQILKKYWELNNHGFEPTIGDRDTLTYQLACDLRHICGKNADWLDQVIPCYNGFPEEEKRAKIKSALSSEYNGFPQRLRNTLNALTSPDLPKGEEGLADEDDNEDAVANSSLFTIPSSLRRMPQGIRDSIDAVGPQLSMPVITAICPCIGTLATGVTLDVHGQKRGLNLISYIAGDFASGKGGIDPVVEAWMSEVQALDKMYQVQEDEWRAKKRAAKNKKEQPEEPKLPVRCLTLNNTVANLAERLANTEGKHAFSFTPEADTVAQKWKSTMSDFSVMLRQSYDGTKYEREARSADAVNVHIDKLLWNVCMCGTPDALYRVVNNYTDGFQSRIAVARTPDNTFAPLQDKPPVLTDRQRDRIQQIAHLLPLMYGEVVLPKLEAKGREWVERIRLETMKNDDRTRARQRFRVCVTAQRMTCCLMLCKVCEGLIQKHGLTGAEAQLKQQPGLWKEMLLKAQTPTMLEVYDVIADSLLENALYFFRDRIENAFQSRDYAGNMNGERTKRGKNDSIFERLDIQFSFEQAMQQSVAVKGANVNHNTVRQMLKNWRKQKLVALEEDGKYRKV
ncbi:DUF3987 domain-containing protein [Prevotella communis]|uniref:DUF3987 domain-containing protein n=1 Tax=Prevotella communis TaxID=2913614 RepID=UPI001EDA7E3C|nr:DUF3987 domain-containing protein [Prevotella communis]UKK68494.1 DUF3987 domain-containing protein [Prevotella communis]UKK69371.1 DUF3987 domain-containing protein [Prevotella communis]